MVNKIQKQKHKTKDKRTTLVVLRNNCKGHMDKTKGGWDQGRELGMAGVAGSSEAKMETTVLEQQ